MATKSYSKHKEYKEFKSSGNVPYTDEQFDMLKGELLPKSKLESLGKSGAGAREYHYEYKEEKHPSGKYDRKDLRTVEEYTVPPKTVPKNKESSSYYYEREERELPSINKASAMKTYHYDSSTSSTPGYSKVKQTNVKKDLSHNVEELDSLLDDLQKDQERQLYKSGYTSDTAESTSFDYKRGTPMKAPSSGYSTLKKEERVETSSWGSSPPPPVASTLTRAEQQIYREETHESRVVPSQVSPAIAQPVPAPVCAHCHHGSERTGTLTRSSTPMNKVTTTVKTYTYEVPADQDPTTVPIPVTSEKSERYLTEQRVTSASNQLVPPSPSLGCQYCAHCNSSVTTRREILPATTSHTYHHVSTDDRTNERILYPAPTPAADSKPAPAPAHPGEPYTNGHGPYSPTQYKYTETSYSAQNTTERYPPAGGTFPRPLTPSPGDQKPPKKLDDLLADFPEARFPSQPDGVVRRVHVSHERSGRQEDQRALTPAAKPPPPVGSSRNVAGPAVYYPPGHTPFEKKEVQPSAAYQASASQGGGAYASGRGMYEYEAGSKSKEKHSEKKTAVPICLPLCCAMPCVIM